MWSPRLHGALPLVAKDLPLVGTASVGQRIKEGPGSRKPKDVNKDLLEKVIWRIHKEGTSIWVQLLKFKYKMKTLDDLNLKLGSRASSIRRSICWSKDLFQKGMGRCVMNNRSTLFWTNRWLGNVTFLDIAFHPPPSYFLLHIVSEY